jgi:predicted adenylyl cyclase CyaB
MNRNVEIKARVADPDKLLRLVQNIADSGPEVLNQEDVFFQCPSGRLKLRTINGKESQLIFYVRDDNPSPKASEYALVPVSDPAAMRRVLELALGTRGIVRKRRTLFLVGPTRIHLDEVEGLGSFIELEVVLKPAESIGDGVQIARQIIEKLKIDETSLIAGAYLDLQGQSK